LNFLKDCFWNSYKYVHIYAPGIKWSVRVEIGTVKASSRVVVNSPSPPQPPIRHNIMPTTRSDRSGWKSMHIVTKARPAARSTPNIRPTPLATGRHWRFPNNRIFFRREWLTSHPTPSPQPSPPSPQRPKTTTLPGCPDRHRFPNP